MLNLCYHRSTVARASLIMATLGAGAFPGAAAAQGAASDAGLEDIVVTAQRRSEKLSEVPVSVQAISGADLISANVSGTRMLENISPSVSFSNGFNSAATSVSIRGVSSASFEGGIQPSVALVIDGVPVARQNEFLVDFADIERVEVLSGPQGTLFGKNATAGVVNILTKRPAQRFEGSIQALATTDDEYSVKGVINTPLSPAAALRLTAFYRDQNPIIENIGGRDAGGNRSYGLSGGLLVDLSDAANFLLRGSYSRVKSSESANIVIVPISGPLGVLQTQVIGVPVGRGAHKINHDGYNHDHSKNWNVTGELNWDLSDALSLVSVTGFRSVLNENDIDADGTPIGVSRGTGFTPNPLGYPLMWVNFGKNRIYDRLRYASQEFRLNYTDGGFNLIVGAFGQTYRETRNALQGLVFTADYAGLTGPGLPGTTPFFNNGDVRARIRNQTGAIFGDLTYEASPTINLFGGLRYTVESLKANYRRDDYFNLATGFFNPLTLTNSAPPIATTVYARKRTDHNLSGRAGIQWQPDRGQNYYFSYSRGYKGAAADIAQAASLVDPLLDPEIGSSFELGTKQRFWNGRLSLDIALYRQRINNIQQASIRPNTFLTNLINAGQLRSDGIEVNLGLAPAPGLRLTVGGAYTDARYNGGLYPCNPTELANNSPKCDANGIKSLTGEQTYGAPKFKLNATVNYDYDLGGPLTITSQAMLNYQSSIQYQLGNDPLTREPSRGIVNLSLGVKSDDDRLEVTAFVNNLTNHFYYNYLNHADFFIGRSFGILPRDYKRYAGIRGSYAF